MIIVILSAHNSYIGRYRSFAHAAGYLSSDVLARIAEVEMKRN